MCVLHLPKHTWFRIRPVLEGVLLAQTYMAWNLRKHTRRGISQRVKGVVLAQIYWA